MTKVLFVHGGSRWSFDENGTPYTDANLNEQIWDRYRACCGRLTVLMRREERVRTAAEAAQKLNRYDSAKSDLVTMPDIYRPLRNFFKLSCHREMRRIIRTEVQKADKVIIRSLGNLYTVTALKYAQRYRKPYLIEVTGLAWEGSWHHSLRGKLIAGYNELQYRLRVRHAPYVLYVTKQALQKRYPSSGLTLGCSDVDCSAATAAVLEQRLEHIRCSSGRRLVLGTAAALDVRYKGQEYVLRAMAELKKRGIDCFEYQLIGAGTGRRLLAIAKDLGIADRLHIVGLLSHEQVYDWYDQVDIYIQPSYQEGLCRALVEAMSRACPIVSTDVGGNPELTAPDKIFKRGHSRQLADILQVLTAPSDLAESARYSYKKSQEYDKSILDKTRREFLETFINGQ